MHYDLLIITDEIIPANLLSNINYCIKNNEVKLISPYETNSHITFDYLIFSNPSSIEKIDLLKEDSYIVTNLFFQTSIDHMFAIGSCNKSQKAIQEQWEIILNFIKFGE
ncbi:MAG: hypothetical protein AB7V00_02035 [Bacilli bacterium]